MNSEIYKKYLDVKIRRNKILEIIQETNGNISQNDLILKLVEAYPDYDIRQSYISKDLKHLKIVKVNGIYEVGGDKQRVLNETKLKKLADESNITASDIIMNVKAVVIRSNNIGRNYLFAEYLMNMYPDIIIDTVCTDKTIMVYFISKKGDEDVKLTKEIRSILSE